MKIIKNALTDPWTKKIECNKCKSVLEIDEEDIQFVTNLVHDELLNKVPYITCPICEDKKYLYPLELPTAFKMWITDPKEIESIQTA
jgi:hypothetical protein